MLPKERRLRKKSDFDRVFQTGKVVKLPLLRLVWMPGMGRGAVAVSRQVGSIARRITVKRRWREALGQAAIPADKDFVVVVGTAGAKTRGAELRAALETALSIIEA